MEILDDLDEYYFNDTTREEFIQEIVDYEDLAQNKSEEKLIKSIVKHMDKGNYRYILNMYKKIEKLNLDNPAIFFLKAKTLENLKQTNYERPNFHPQYETLLKTLQYAKKMPKIEYYLDIALTVQMMGFFYASYILSLSLLRFLPMDTQLNLVAGYSAHQLMLPFKDFLFKGSIVEPVRMINFINEYWYPYRFKSQDNTKKYNIRKSTIESLKEEADKQWKNIPFHEFISVLDPEIFGFEFPYQDLLGISLQEICDYHEFDIKEEDLEWDDWDCTTINNVKEKGEIIIDPTSIDGDIFRTFEEFLEKKNQIFSECNQFYIKIVEDWLSSQEYLSLPKYTWKSRDNIIMTALSLNLEINGTLPPDWNWDDMEDILINTFSSRIDAPKYFFKSIGRVMQNFCTFLHKEKQYSNLKDFPNKIKKISKDIINASENLKN